MRKIPTLFMRNYETDRLVRDEITPGCEWVINGEGIATRKYDGTCCMIAEGVLYKRYESKKEPPDDFIPAQDRDPVTGHWVGWRPCRREEPSDQYHWQAFDFMADRERQNGTYELIGPKVQGNPENMLTPHLINHIIGTEIYLGFPRSFNAIRDELEIMNIEGIVWHHDDGRMCKIKKKDFGFKR